MKKNSNSKKSDEFFNSFYEHRIIKHISVDGIISIYNTDFPTYPNYRLIQISSFGSVSTTESNDLQRLINDLNDDFIFQSIFVQRYVGKDFKLLKNF